jgi:hypothetical protein
VDALSICAESLAEVLAKLASSQWLFTSAEGFNSAIQLI